jgi:hypothetical protein
LADPELASDLVEVGKLERDSLGPAQAAGVEQAQERGVTSTPCDGSMAIPRKVIPDGKFDKPSG